MHMKQAVQHLVYILGRVAELVYLALLQRRRRSIVVTSSSSSTNDELAAVTASDSVATFFVPTPPVK